MNIRFSTTSNFHHRSLRKSDGSGQESIQPSTTSAHKKTEYNERLRINTTASENACGRLSFKCNPAEESVSLMKKFGKWAAGTKGAGKMLEFIQKNNAPAEAIFALFLTCGARPATIMMQPTKNEEDKKKNIYASAKSAGSGIVGLLTTLVVSKPINNAVARAMSKIPSDDSLFDIANIMTAEAYGKNIDNNSYKKVAQKIKEHLQRKIDDPKLGEELKESFSKRLKELNSQDELNVGQSACDFYRKLFSTKEIKKLEQKLTEGLNVHKVKEFAKMSEDQITEEVAKLFTTRLKSFHSIKNSFMQKLHNPIFLPAKAYLTVALVPVILGVVGIKKQSKNKNEAPKAAETQDIKIAQQLPPQPTSKVFSTFTGVAKNAN